MDKITPTNPRTWQIAWAVVFVVNLCVPLLFGWGITSKSGRIGMMAAIGLFWVLGHYGSGKRGRLGFILVVGGSLVGLSQFWPMLQIFAGIVSMNVVGKLGQTSGSAFETDHLNSELGGFLATALTGGLLLTAAVFLGLIASLAFEVRGERSLSSSSHSGVYDRELDA